jgi:hypothetical protein
LELAFFAHFAVPPYESRRATESGGGTLREISSKPGVVFELAYGGMAATILLAEECHEIAHSPE